MRDIKEEIIISPFTIEQYDNGRTAKTDDCLGG